MHRALPAVIVRVVVVLEEVPDEELALRLRAQHQSETDAVEAAPREGVHRMHRDRVGR